MSASRRRKLCRRVRNCHKEAQSVAHIGHWELYPEIGTPVWSDEIFRIFGLNPQEREPSFTDHETHLHPDDWPLLNKVVTLASTEGTPYDIVFRIVRPDGEIRWMHTIGTTTKDEKGKVIKLFGTAQDITDLNRSEEALRESEEKYRLLVENANDAIFVVQDGVIKFPNAKAEALTGYSAEELNKIPFVNHIHPDDKEMVIERHKRRLEGEDLVSSYSYRAIKKSGEDSWHNLSTVFITWEGRPATLNFVRDITEEKRLESQLQHAKKMESIGTLAGGIAHNFNNLLMGIQGNASIMFLDY